MLARAARAALVSRAQSRDDRARRDALYRPSPRQCRPEWRVRERACGA